MLSKDKVLKIFNSFPGTPTQYGGRALLVTEGTVVKTGYKCQLIMEGTPFGKETGVFVAGDTAVIKTDGADKAYPKFERKREDPLAQFIISRVDVHRMLRGCVFSSVNSIDRWGDTMLRFSGSQVEFISTEGKRLYRDCIKVDGECTGGFVATTLGDVARTINTILESDPYITGVNVMVLKSAVGMCLGQFSIWVSTVQTEMRDGIARILDKEQHVCHAYSLVNVRGALKDLSQFASTSEATVTMLGTALSVPSKHGGDYCVPYVMPLIGKEQVTLKAAQFNPVLMIMGIVDPDGSAGPPKFNLKYLKEMLNVLGDVVTMYYSPHGHRGIFTKPEKKWWF